MCLCVCCQPVRPFGFTCFLTPGLFRCFNDQDYLFFSLPMSVGVVVCTVRWFVCVVGCVVSPCVHVWCRVVCMIVCRRFVCAIVHLCVCPFMCLCVCSFDCVGACWVVGAFLCVYLFVRATD